LFEIGFLFAGRFLSPAGRRCAVADHGCRHCVVGDLDVVDRHACEGGPDHPLIIWIRARGTGFESLAVGRRRWRFVFARVTIPCVFAEIHTCAGRTERRGNFGISSVRSRSLGMSDACEDVLFVGFERRRGIDRRLHAPARHRPNAPRRPSAARNSLAWADGFSSATVPLPARNFADAEGEFAASSPFSSKQFAAEQGTPSALCWEPRDQETERRNSTITADEQPRDDPRGHWHR